MSWTYDATELGTSTEAERLNSVRLFVGDTDTTDQQVQNEEITFALSQTNNNVYSAASFTARLIASKYSRLVNTELDGMLMAEYSDLAKQYSKLSKDLDNLASEYGTPKLGVVGGGLTTTQIDAVRTLTTRVNPSFRMDRFRIDTQEYLTDYTQ